MMLERSEMSFIFLWVINPIVILFYQNCASVPVERATTKISSATEIVQDVTRAPACRMGECAQPVN